MHYRTLKTSRGCFEGKERSDAVRDFRSIQRRKLARRRRDTTVGYADLYPECSVAKWRGKVSRPYPVLYFLRLSERKRRGSREYADLSGDSWVYCTVAKPLHRVYSVYFCVFLRFVGMWHTRLQSRGIHSKTTRLPTSVFSCAVPAGVYFMYIKAVFLAHAMGVQRWANDRRFHRWLTACAVCRMCVFLSHIFILYGTDIRTHDMKYRDAVSGH